jgi:hypothetical protein
VFGGGVTAAVRPVSIQPGLPKLNPSATADWIRIMATHKFFTSALFALVGFSMTAVAAAQSGEPDVSMDQAVRKVQRETGGKVLSAEPHHVGRRTEYRIKVLTPQGHVRVMAIPSDASKSPMTTPVFTPSIKNPPGRTPGSKERH